MRVKKDAGGVDNTKKKWSKTLSCEPGQLILSRYLSIAVEKVVADFIEKKTKRPDHRFPAVSL